MNAVSPIESGSFQIDVEASYRGQTGKAVIRQTNFPTTADAKAAGREPGKSTNSTTQAATDGGTANAATGSATAATTGATGTAVPATTAATSAAAAGGGGMSKLAVAGLLAGGAAGAGAAVVLTQRQSEPAATVAPIVASQAVGIYAGTVFTFSAQGTGFEAASLTYLWEFGDGVTSTEPSPTWVRTGGGITWFITQSGGTITGTSDVVTFPNIGVQTVYTGCALSGSVQRARPVAVTRSLLAGRPGPVSHHCGQAVVRP